MSFAREPVDSVVARNRYGILFATLSLLFVVTPQLGGVLGARMLTLSSLLVLLGVVAAVSPRLERARWLVWLAVLIMPLLVWRVIEPASDAGELLARSSLGGFLAVSVVVILRDVLRSRDIGPEAIYGALSVYLLVAALFSILYWATYHLDPQSFRVGDSDDRDPWLYYSLVTLTTLGYGDIVPLTPPARMLSAFQAVLGQIYLAVLIARLVGLSIVERTAPGND